jgi:hypothetical protein
MLFENVLKILKMKNLKFENKYLGQNINMYNKPKGLYLFISVYIDNLFIFYLFFIPIQPSSRHVVFQVSPVDRGT